MDIEYFDIDLKEEDIIKMKKSSFKSLVLEHTRQAALIYLSELKAKHSKSVGLKISEQTKEYLTTPHLTISEKQTLFKLRTRTFECKENFKNQFESLKCNFCEKDDIQEHLLNCEKITDGIDTNGINYNHIFGKISEQVKIARVMNKIAEKRKSLNSSSSFFRKPGASHQMPHVQTTT